MTKLAIIKKQDVTPESHIRKKGQISRREYAKQAGVSPETAKRDLTKLVEDGVLAVHRAGRSTIYKLIGS
jgi:DeoR/GlpR family transcriptional regulator of sugar metabolism